MTRPIALIVEDDEDLSDIFAEALSAAGFEPQIIRDGRQALEELETIQPIAIILDLHLPHVPGRDILAYVRGQERFASTRVVVVTADALSGEMMTDEADFVLIKPVSYAQLRDLAKRLSPSRGQ